MVGSQECNPMVKSKCRKQLEPTEKCPPRSLQCPGDKCGGETKKNEKVPGEACGIGETVRKGKKDK